jgi:hypothetical protein
MFIWGDGIVVFLALFSLLIWVNGQEVITITFFVF